MIDVTELLIKMKSGITFMLSSVAAVRNTTQLTQTGDGARIVNQSIVAD